MSITQWFAAIPLNIKLLFAYIVLINVITFFFFGVDKLKAYVGNRRISERTLWFLVAIGGTIGGYAAMEFFRHKTRKTSFQLGFVLIFFTQLVLLLLLF